MYNFWTGAGGIDGDYSYGITHIIAVIALIIITTVITIYGCKVDSKKQRKIIIGLAIFGLGFELFWRLVYFFAHDQAILDMWPMYPCNLAGIIIPLIALSNNKTLKTMFYYFAFVGGIITFVYPQGIFTNAYLNFPILKSVLQHVAIIIIPVFEYFTKIFRPKFKHFYLVIVGLLINVFNSEIIARVILKNTGDYMFFRGTLPFVIPGVPQYITLSIFALLVLLVGLAFLDMKSFKKTK